MSSTNNYRRYNPLLDEWIIVASNRVNRPWNGANTEKAAGFQKTDKINALAPGGVRSNGMITPDYLSTFVFDNDFPSFTNFSSSDEKVPTSEVDSLFRQDEIRGVCRVISYHPNTEKTMATLSEQEMLKVIDIWISQFAELKQMYRWIQIFENRGAAVGCSNAHPHGQLWAGDFLPNLPSRKDKAQKAYYARTDGRVMLVDYLEKEIEKKERIVLRNEHWTVLVPFWACWPYETLLLPNRHVLRLDDLHEKELITLADILRKIVTKYDNIFECTFPYCMGWSGAPTGSSLTENCSHWQLHATFLPPLLRSATVPKYMAGYEILAEPQRDITPEQAAKTIREQPEVHYAAKVEK